MRPRGILFDKDGTLVDFQGMWEPAFVEVAGRIHALGPGTPSIDELLLLGGWNQKTGIYTADSLLAAGTTAEVADFWAALPPLQQWSDTVRAMVHDAFDRHATQAPRGIGDIASLFARLKAADIAVGIATNDKVAGAHAALESLKCTADFVAGYDSGYGSKPDPGMVTAFINSLSPPGDVMMVGDAVGDLVAGRAAGAKWVVGVTSGFSQAEVLEPDADFIVGDVHELVDRILGPVQGASRTR